VKDQRGPRNTFPRRTERAAIETKNGAGQAICPSQRMLGVAYSQVTLGASTVCQFITS